jgi:hypothetical protein
MRKIYMTHEIELNAKVVLIERALEISELEQVAGGRVTDEGMGPGAGTGGSSPKSPWHPHP